MFKTPVIGWIHHILLFIIAHHCGVVGLTFLLHVSGQKFISRQIQEEVGLLQVPFRLARALS